MASSSQPSEPLSQIQQLLQQLQDQLQQPGSQLHLAPLQTAFQQYFADLNELAAAQARPLQVEVNKQLRLLEADSRFLGAARQAETVQQRKLQIQQRLDLLNHYRLALAAL